MLCLTDMWRVSGADPSKRPAKWRETDAAREFIAYIASDIRREDIALFEAAKGGADAGGTYAHWQIGLAYAKYLSPPFHAWCNTVVRGYIAANIGIGDNECFHALGRGSALRGVFASKARPGRCPGHRNPAWGSALV